MKLSQESIFSASLRSFFTSAFAVIGVAVASLPFFILSSTVMDERGNEPTSLYQAVVLSDENGQREVLKSKGPFILQINIQGPIGNKKLNAEGIQQQLQEAKEGIFKNGRIRAILLNISSPGGTVHDSDSIYRSLQSFKKELQIPIFAYVDGLCASGGVYVACAADKIYSSPVSLVGSVGVIMQFMNASEAMEKLGLSSKTLIAGKEKDAMNPLRPWSPDEESHYQHLTDSFYHRFVEIVTKARPKISQDQLIDDLGAKIFNAEKALEIGLIDHAQAERQDVLRELAKEASIEGDYQVLELRTKNAWMPQWLDAKFGEESSTFSRLSAIPFGDLIESAFLQEKFLYLYRP